MMGVIARQRRAFSRGTVTGTRENISYAELHE